MNEITKGPWIMIVSREDAFVHSDNGGTIAHIPNLDINWKANTRAISLVPDMVGTVERLIRQCAMLATIFNLKENEFPAVVIAKDLLAKLKGGD